MLSDQANSGERKSLMEKYSRLGSYYKIQINRLCVKDSSEEGSDCVIVFLDELRGRRKCGFARRTREQTRVQIVLRRSRGHGERASQAVPSSRDGPNSLGDSPEFEDQQGPIYLERAKNPGDKPSSLATSIPQGNRATDGEGSQRSGMAKVPQPASRIHHYHLSDWKGPSDATPFAQVEEKANQDQDSGRYPRKGTTTVSKAIIDVKAVSGSGYDYTIEDGKVLIGVALSWTELKRLRERTERLRELSGVDPYEEVIVRRPARRLSSRPQVSFDLLGLGSRYRTGEQNLLAYPGHGYEDVS